MISTATIPSQVLAITGSLTLTLLFLQATLAKLMAYFLGSELGAAEGATEGGHGSIPTQ